jgi:hypothetical protein
MKSGKDYSLALMILVLIIAAMSSCKTQGYGCKGKESWNGMVRRINWG